jgi:hypothetical protein
MPSIAAIVKNPSVVFMVGFDLLTAIVPRSAGFVAIERSLLSASETNVWRTSHVCVTRFKASPSVSLTPKFSWVFAGLPQLNRFNGFPAPTPRAGRLRTTENHHLPPGHPTEVER